MAASRQIGGYAVRLLIFINATAGQCLLRSAGMKFVRLTGLQMRALAWPIAIVLFGVSCVVIIVNFQARNKAKLDADARQQSFLSDTDLRDAEKAAIARSAKWRVHQEPADKQSEEEVGNHRKKEKQSVQLAELQRQDYHFDANEPERLLEWATTWEKKYYAHEFENIAFSDGILSMQCNDAFNIDGIFDSAFHTYHILMAYKKAASNQSELKAIRITYRKEFADKHGVGIGLQPILTVQFDALEAMKYNFENAAVTYNMVDSASVEYLHPAAQDAPERYCRAHGKVSPIFCRRYWPDYLLNEN